VRNLKEVLDEVLKKRVPANMYENIPDKKAGKGKFVIRRWYQT